jgi:Protein of unknown function (DUF2637)
MRDERACRPVDQVDDDACVGLLALIAGIVSYLHMHMLVALHGQPGWVAVLTPLSVDGMIVAASSNARAQQASSASETRPMTAVVTKKRYWQSPRRDQRLVWRRHMAGASGLVSCHVPCHSDVSCRLDR